MVSGFRRWQREFAKHKPPITEMERRVIAVGAKIDKITAPLQLFSENCVSIG